MALVLASSSDFGNGKLLDSFTGLVTDPFLSGIIGLCFCTQDAFHIRIRKDCSEQECVCGTSEEM